MSNDTDNDIVIVDITPLKRTAKKFPEDEPIRKVILSQPDKMPLTEYLIKARDWVLLMPDAKTG